MRKIKEILLKFDLGLKDRAIARSCSIPRSSVANYISRAQAVGLSWPLPPDLDDAASWGRLLVLGHRAGITGADRIPRGEAVIFASNHQSSFDIPLLHAVLPVTYRWLSRHDLFKTPFLGRALYWMEAIEVVRGDRRQAVQVLRNAIDALGAGHNLVIFPECTWGDQQGRMREFKEGIFTIARKANARVVPLTIVGSNRVNPSFTKTVNRGPLHIIVHEPLPPPDETARPREWLDALRAIIAGPLPHGTDLAQFPESVDRAPAPETVRA